MAAALSLPADSADAAVAPWSDPTDRADFPALVAMALAENELEDARHEVDLAEAGLVDATTRAVEARERLDAAIHLVAAGLGRLASLRGER